MVWPLLLLALAVTLEKVTERPFLATRWGELLAWALGGRRLDAHRYEAPKLPAVGFRAVAQTWGETVIVSPDLPSGPRRAQLLAHEACHVAQYRRLTSLGFWLRYLLEWVWGLVRYRNAFEAYLAVPLELEARSAERSLLTDGVTRFVR